MLLGEDQLVVTVQDCERVQAGWLSSRTLVSGGAVWEDGGLSWAAGPQGGYLLFPVEVNEEALHRGIRRVDALAARPIGAWLGEGVATAVLRARGFEPGWSPWWMAAPLILTSTSDAPDGPRVETRDVSTKIPGPGVCSTSASAGQVWSAVSYTSDGTAVGSAWSFYDREFGVAGVFDMGVEVSHRRRGHGTALLRAVCTAARDAGATTAVLNATPDGAKLYSARGFEALGAGAPTWWLHNRRRRLFSSRAR